MRYTVHCFVAIEGLLGFINRIASGTWFTSIVIIIGFVCLFVVVYGDLAIDFLTILRNNAESVKKR